MINKYPYTDFNEYNLDWCITRIRDLSTEWAETKTEWSDMKTEFSDLKNYVTNYFANLDVQDEIDHKIDNMIEDGTFDVLIKPIFDELAVDINHSINVLSARMDEFSALTDGSTTGDAELADIRIGTDGVTYPNAGDAVRGQVENLIKDINPEYSNGKIDFTWTLNNFINPDGTEGSAATYATSNYVHVLENERLYNLTDVYRQGLGDDNIPYITYVAFYDEFKAFVSRSQFGTYTLEYIVPQNGYIRLVFGLPQESGLSILATDTAKVSVSKYDKTDALELLNDDKKVVEKLLEIAKTYQSHISDFTYGSANTAFSPSCTNELDCSSFHSLIMKGITYDKSRYYTDAADNDVNQMYFLDMDAYPRISGGSEISGTYDDDGYPHCRYAYQQAQWLYDHGFTYKPTPDMTNIEPGDSVFFSFNDPSTPPENVITWKDGTTTMIDHVAIFLGKTSAGRYMLLQYGDYEAQSTTPTTVFEFGTSMSACVLCAHVPYAFRENLPSNLSTNKMDKKSADGHTTIDQIKLSEPLIPGEAYTLVFYGRTNLTGKYFLLQSSSWQTIFSDSTDTVQGIEKLKCIHFICPVISDYTKFWLNTSGTATSGAQASYAYGIRLYKGYVMNGVKGDASVIDSMRNITPKSLQNLLDVINAELNTTISIDSYNIESGEYTFTN